jgi:hypothetical protein
MKLRIGSRDRVPHPRDVFVFIARVGGRDSQSVEARR